MALELTIKARMEQLRKEFESIPGMTKKNMREAMALALAELKEADRKAAAEAKANSTTAVDRAEAQAKQLKQLKELGKAIGGSFGGATNAIEDIAGAAATGLGPVALLAAGLVATGAAIVAVGSYSVATARDIDDLAASFTLADREALQPQIAALTEAKEALEGYDYASKRLQVTLAGTTAPAVEKFTDALAGLKLGASSAAEEIGGFETAWAVVTHLPVAGPLARIVDTLADVGREAREARPEVHALYEELSKLNEAGVPKGLARPPDEVPDALRGDGLKDLEDQEKKRSEVRRKQREEDLKDIAEFHRLEREQDEATAKINEDFEAELDKKRGQWTEERWKEEIKAAEERKRLAKEVADKEIEEARRSAEVQAHARQSTVEGVLAVTGKMVDLAATIGDLMMTTAQNQVDAQGRVTAQGRKQMREAFEVQKGAAIASIVVNTASASVAALDDAPYPLNLVLAGLIIAEGVAQGAIVGSQQPNFDVGGVIRATSQPAPDRLSVLAQPGEAVLNRRAVADLGEDGVHRLNAGRGRAQSVGVAIALRHRVLDEVIADGLGRVNSPLRRVLRRGEFAGQRRRAA